MYNDFLARKILPQLVYPCFLFVVMISPLPCRAQNYETTQLFSASQVLPDNLRSGKDFRVDDQVLCDGYLYSFNVESAYGDYQVRGIFALKKLVREIGVIRSLKEFTRTKVFTDATKKAGNDLLTSPIRVAESFASIVTNPEESLETVKKVPEGVANLFSWAGSRVKSGAATVGSFFSSDTTSTKTEKKQKSQGDLTKQATEQAQKTALDYIGYNKKAAAWYERYALDPNTKNEPLRAEIQRIAEVETVVKTAFRFVPGLISLGIIGDVNSYWEQAKKLSIYADPNTLLGKNKAALKEIGSSDEVTAKFLANKNFTSTTRSFLLDGIIGLAALKNYRSLVSMAAEVQTEDGAVFFTRSVLYLRTLSRQGIRFVAIAPNTSIPIAQALNGNFIVPLPLDHLLWTKNIASSVAELRSRIKSKRPNTVRLDIEGSCSPRFLTEMNTLGVTVMQGVKIGDTF